MHESEVWADADVLLSNLEDPARQSDDDMVREGGEDVTGPGSPAAWDGTLEPWEARVLRRPVNR